MRKHLLSAVVLLSISVSAGAAQVDFETGFYQVAKQGMAVAVESKQSVTPETAAVQDVSLEMVDSVFQGSPGVLLNVNTFHPGAGRRSGADEKEDNKLVCNSCHGAREVASLITKVPIAG